MTETARPSSGPPRPALLSALYEAQDADADKLRKLIEAPPAETPIDRDALDALADDLDERHRAGTWDETDARKRIASILGIELPNDALPKPVTGEKWKDPVPDRDWLVKDWLPAGELSMLAGPGEMGKSPLLLQLACALASDHHVPWLPAGEKVETRTPALASDPGAVVLANWEDSANETLRRRLRLHKYGSCECAADESIDRHLHVFPMRGAGPLVAPAGTGHMAHMGKLTGTGNALFAYCERAKARLLVLDPASLALSVEENSRPLVSLALEILAGWCLSSGCAVMITGHPAKAAEGESSDYSGSTAWRGLVRSLWTLKPPMKENENAPPENGTLPNGERQAVLKLNKANYSMSGTELTLQTVGKRAAWHLFDPNPEEKSQTGGREKKRKSKVTEEERSLV